MMVTDKPAAALPHPMIRLLGAVIWPSFFVAALLAAALFTFVDPLQLQRAGVFPFPVSRSLGYSVGFFGLWLGTLCACSVTALLLRPATDEPEPYE